jgi:phenylpyruvate tautomerase PptA (4-oxalocrotonate tautomerase family)
MPVVRIQALPQADGVDIDAALAAVCRDVATLLGEEPRGTWATWQTLDHYVEGDDARATQPHDTHPPLVSVTAYEGRSAELVADIVRCVATTLAREFGLDPGNVFVTYDEAHAGRLFTGGDVVG